MGEIATGTVYICCEQHFFHFIKIGFVEILALFFVLYLPVRDSKIFYQPHVMKLYSEVIIYFF